jgi:hypothetical protein
MRKPRFTDEQMVAIIQRRIATVAEVAKHHAISEQNGRDARSIRHGPSTRMNLNPAVASDPHAFEVSAYNLRFRPTPS